MSEVELNDLGGVSVVEKTTIDREFDIPAIEHILFGSGINVDGRIINSNAIKNDLEQRGGIPANLFIPAAKERGDKISEINKRRKEQMDFEGIWGPFDLDKADQRVFNERLTPVIELGMVNEDGMIPAKWKFRVKKENGKYIDDIATISKIFPFSPDLIDLFRFEEVKKIDLEGKEVVSTLLTINPDKIIN